MKENINFLLCGVGGQGTILASDVLVNVGLAVGFQAKQAEVHGMSQRGGSVTSMVRWGQTVYSPLVGAGEVDVLLSFEKMEALRNLTQLRPGALALVNTQVIEPLTVISGDQVYPTDETIREAFARVTDKVIYINGEQIAKSLGNLRVANVVLLGALSALLEREPLTGAELDLETWLKVISERVPPKHVELNRKAFQTGRDAVAGD
ncbi:MAG: indolepyruvate oxidoreductase subunit beta [Chloroflexota bacterium]